MGGAAVAAPATWVVDPAKSSISFTVTVNGQPVQGAFKSFGATIAFDPADLAHSSAKVIVPMDAAKTGDATRDAMLLKPAWFNVLDFPKAVYQTTSIAHVKGNKYLAKGTLTLKGTTQPMLLNFSVDIKGDTATMIGAGLVKRLSFKVGEGPDFASGKPVALNVVIMVNVTAKRAK
jgi:polyisoprenoid-binding protein YceI